MRNNQSPRILFIALAVEVMIALFFLIFRGGLGTIFTIFLLVIFIGGGLFLLARNGMLSLNWFDEHNQHNHHNHSNKGWSNMSWSGPTQPEPISGGSNFNLNVGLNINPGFERQETFEQEFPVTTDITTLQVDVNNGNLKVVGEAGLTQIRLNAVKRVWERDEASVQHELDRLQVRSRQEGQRLIIEAGQFDNPASTLGFSINLGKSPRIDLELVVPPALAASFATNTGTLEVRELEGEIAARTVAGPISIQNINGGRNLTIGTQSGRIAMQQITAGTLRARATTGALNLTALGADAIELETMAGSVQVRGVNCGRLAVNAATGSIELTDINVDGALQLKATAGRIQTNNIRAATFNIETTTGTIRFQGSAPTAPSTVQTGVGSTELIFAPGANFQLEARSNIGSVQVVLPVSNTFTTNQNYFRGQIGVGGPLLNVSSQVGSVRISQG